MKCLFCASDQSTVIDKRSVKSTGEIRRRRECLKCKQRYTTYEKIGTVDFFVIKRDGRKELFDRDKLKAGIKKALEKRPSFENIEELVDDVVSRIKAKGKKDVESKVLGRVVLSELKKIDKVAYLRFVSVYRQFKDPVDFSKELENLKI